MSGRKKGQAELAPSLFPFLAVLLCTVGALVLILVLVVGQSAAAVKQAADTHAERTAELRAQVELVRDSFEDARETIQLEIEKKRMSLQSLEKQTADLLKELKDLEKTGELIDKKLTDAESSETVDKQLTELEKELQEAAEQLKTKLDKPTGNKPVFAIIPYTGNNGTHRRPIYLECRADGIVVQPEGVLIGLKDLKPPYGPGNPLDAALRTIRTRYAPKDGALNSSAYPLLVVRSSGIRTYALARMAMAGWDDQFGYELIDDEMELDFPPGEPGLAKDIEQSLVAARNRQAALVMAMPGKYRRAMAELSDDDFNFEEGSGEGGGWGGESDGSGNGSGDGVGAGSGPGSAGGPGMGSGSGSGMDGAGGAGGSVLAGGQDPSGGGMSAGPGRGGFAFTPDGSRTGLPPGGNLPAGGNGGGLQGFATGGNAPDGADSSGGLPGGQPLAGGPGQMGGASGGANSFAEGAFSGNRYTSAGSGGSSSTGSSGEAGGQMAMGGQGDAQANSGNRAGTFRDAMNAARAKSLGSSDSQSSQPAAGGKDGGTGGSQTVSPRSEGFASVSGQASDVDAQPQVGLETKLSGRKQEHAEAVAKRKGRNWAWSAGPPRDTAVVRAIRVACYEDRWVVLAEPAAGEKAQTVMLDVSLQTSAEELAKVIAGRVDRWGFALAGGYWKPVLVVEVADGGQRRFEQLKRLLDGSGLEIQAGGPAK